MECLPNKSQILLLKACLEQSDKANWYLQEWKKTIGINLDAAIASPIGLPQIYDKLDFGSQRLLSLLYHNLERLQVEEPGIKKLRGYFKYIWVKNQVLRKELNLIAEKLQSTELKLVSFKGVRIAEEYYPHLGSRPTVDLDLVANPEDLEVLDQLFRSLGWQPKLSHTTIPVMTHMLSHAITLTKDNLELDLHIRFSQYLFKEQTRLRFWNKAIRKDNGISHLHPAHELFCSILHGMVNGPIPTIRWVADSVLILRKFDENDWQEFYDLVKSENYRKLIGQAMAFLKQENMVTISSLMDEIIQDLNTNEEESPFIKLLTTQRRENDFNMFKRHYLTATELSNSFIAKWKLLLKHYKTLWNQPSNTGLLIQASNVLIKKIISPDRK